MEKIEVYNPFNMDSEFHIITDNNKRYFKIENLLLEISENGYIPKSGLLFYDVLNEKNIANKSILDLGCGFLGILGIISMLRGAKTIEAVDYDLNCVYWFNKLISDLYGKQMAGKALCLPTTIGSTTGGLVLYCACSMNRQPACMLFSEPIDSLAAAGAILADVWLDNVQMPVIDSLGEEFLEYVKDDMNITVKEDGTVVVE